MSNKMQEELNTLAEKIAKNKPPFTSIKMN